MSSYYRKNKLRFSTKKEVLKSIWAPDGRIPDLTRLERRRRHWFFRFTISLIIFLGLLAGISWLGLYLTEGKYKEGGVQIDLEAPEEVNNLEEITIKITYRNNDKFPLASSSINLRYPPEIQFEKAEPKADDETMNNWTLGSLEAGKEGSIILQGKVLGVTGSKITLQAILNYKPANFNSEFQSVKTAEIFIKDSPIQMNFDGPTERISGEPLEISLTYQNISLNKLSDIQLALSFPSSFLLEQTEPALTNNQILSIKNLNPGEEKQIKIKGTFPSEAGGNYEFKATASLILDDNNYLLKETNYTIKINKSNLILHLFVNELSENQQIRAGDKLSIRISLDNQSENKLENLTLQFLADSPLIDWESFEGEAKGNLERNRMTWNQNNLAQLGKMEKGDKLDFSFKIKLVPNPNPQIEPLIKLNALVKIGKLNGRPVQTEGRSEEITLKVGSDLQLFSSAYYFNENKQPVGSGPLPPEVGKETHYRLVWQLTNSYHELTNIKVRASLPDNIRFEGQKAIEAGTLSFDPQTRNIIWEINRFPLSVKKLKVEFEVSTIPTEADRGKIILLLSDSQGEALDTALQTSIVVQAKALTSNLEHDKFAEGQGVVR
jgi:hypothetical protein